MTQILRNRSKILEAFDSTLSAYQRNILAMYNSRIQGIILDPTLMSLPIDDHMVHRGHSVFDTLTVINGKAYNLDRHLQRIVNSANLAKIELPMQIETIKQVILDLAACTGKQNLGIRYWISAGPGSMTVWPIPGYSAFYAIAVDKDPLSGFSSVKEFTVSVPIKPRFLAIMKSTNYLLNALCAMESREKGGTYGIQTDERGFITEGSVNNICFILGNKTLVTPTFDKILNGTTIERVFEFSKKLIENGDLAGLEQRDIHIDEAKTSVEVFIASGDSIASVLYWDGQAIGEGVEGPLSKYFKESLIQDFDNPNLTIPINYSSYN